jgi:elongator complex protein 3
MMPGLPGSSPERDIEGFRTIFEDPRFKPDMLKIYPTLVVKGTKLYDWWKNGKYKPLETEEATELVSKVMEMTPHWVRIMRVQRDIPLPRIDAGVDMSNLRQLAEDRLVAQGGRCRCIRCREAGHSAKKADSTKVELTHTVYEASGGIEDFIQAEDREADALIGFVRLRIPAKPFRPELDRHTGLIRELHVYGHMVPVGARRSDAWQHRGWGEALMAEAEKTASERYDIRKMIVMSALGTKQYYARLGYMNKGVYVSKPL